MSEQIDYNNLLFDISKFGSGKSIMDAYPELFAYKEMLEVKEEEWKVAILMVDLGSPFVRIKDPKLKLESIYDALGYDKTGVTYDIFFDAINYRSSGVIDACTFLIEYQNNHEFSAWMELNKLFYDILRLISTPLDPESENYEKDIDTNIRRTKSLDDLQEKLRKYEANLFGSVAMKSAAAFRSKKKLTINWNEKYAVENQVE